ncbi:MAG: RagB/SusD family nutrient uptake outer membrane protein [Bacteroides sp.]|nr:RagB/SusD family nutrient uptake outer membrane protein [Bacteroides sp.]
MKKLTYFNVIAIIVLLLASSCNEEKFLKEEPRDALYPENLLVDYNGFKSMVTPLYGLMRAEYRRADAMGGSIALCLHAAWGGGVDNAWANNSHSAVKFLYDPREITYTDLDIWNNIFQWCYRIINTANMIITRAEAPGINWGGANDADDNKNEVVAEARFFRAWAYRHLTYSFGAVPLSTEEITGLNYRDDWERTPVADIREVMIEDFKFAAENLPLRASNNSKISGAVARHYLGETLLAEGRASEAITELKPLVESNEYQLITERFGENAKNEGCPFIDCFYTPMYADGNTEVLLAFLNTETENSAYGTAQVYMTTTYKNYYANDGTIKKTNQDNPDYEKNDGAGTYAQVFWQANGGKGAGRVVPSRGALRLYNYKDMGEQDDRVSDHAMVWSINDVDATGKVSKVYEINGTQLIDTTVNAKMQTSASIKKYNWPTTRKWNYTPPILANAANDGHYADIVYLRLADSYLLYAEALYKNDQADKAIIWINKVRNRSNAVSISEADLTAGGMDFILDERSRELLTEEERRHTLIRVCQENGGDERDTDNYFKRRMRELNEIAGTEARGMHDYDTPVLFPLPQSFIDSNIGNPLENNPGYK